jgi:MFS family permease
MMTRTKESAIKDFTSRFGGVGAIALLTYVGEYMSFLVALAFLSDKWTVTFHLGSFGYALVGTISAIYLVVSGLIAIPIGHLSDKYGRRSFTIVGSLVGSFALFSLVLDDKLPGVLGFSVAFFISLSALGLAHGTYTASTLAYAGDIATAENLGKPYGLVESAEFAGYAFGPALGTLISVASSRIITFEISGVFLLTSAVLAYFTMKKDTHLAIRAVFERHENEAANVSHGLHDHVEGESVSWKDFIASFRNPILGATLLTTLIGSVAFSGFFYYVPLYAQDLGASIPVLKELSPVFASIMAATGLFLMIPFGIVEDLTERRMPYLSVGLIVGSIALASVFLVPSLFGLLAASLVFGVSLAMSRVSQLVILAERSTPKSRAAVMGTNHAVEHAGYGVGAFIGGVVVALYGFVTSFLDLSLVLLISAILFSIFAFWKKIK